MRTICTILLLFAAIAAEAQATRCGPPGQMASYLTEIWGESVHVRGLAVNGGLVEIWGNAETGTWTITVTTPGGQSCMVASGGDFTVEPAPPAGEES
jgi:hypothetical protein